MTVNTKAWVWMYKNVKKVWDKNPKECGEYIQNIYESYSNFLSNTEIWFDMCINDKRLTFIPQIINDNFACFINKESRQCYYCGDKEMWYGMYNKDRFDNVSCSKCNYINKPFDEQRRDKIFTEIWKKRMEIGKLIEELDHDPVWERMHQSDKAREELWYHKYNSILYGLLE